MHNNYNEMKFRLHFLFILVLSPGLLHAQNMSFAQNGAVIAYKEREFQVTGQINQGLNRNVSPADQYTIHLLKKVSRSGSSKLHKSDFYFAGFCQVLASEADTSEVLIAFHNKNDISKLIMDNYLIPYYPTKRHNLIASLNYGIAPFHTTYASGGHHIISLSGGYRLYLSDHVFSGFNLGAIYFTKLKPYLDIPVGWVINPDTYKNTRASFVFNLRMIASTHDPNALPWYKMLAQGNTSGLFSNYDFLYPSLSLEFFNRGLIVHFPEISMETLSWNNRDVESSLVIGFRLGYGFGFGKNIVTPFK